MTTAANSIRGLIRVNVLAVVDPIDDEEDAEREQPDRNQGPGHPPSHVVDAGVMLRGVEVIAGASMYWQLHVASPGESKGGSERGLASLFRCNKSGTVRMAWL